MILSKSLKKFLFTVPCLILFLICLLSLTGCGAKEKLDAPNTFSIEGSTLSWESVSNATDYIVRINDTDEYETSEESFDISFLLSGVNKIQVKAKETDDYKQSDYGETLYINKLSSPTDIELSGNKVYWSSVEGAVSYAIRLTNSNNEITFETTSNTNNLLFETLQDIIYTNTYSVLSISSIGDGQHNVFEDNTIIFATIPSSFNSGYVINFKDAMPKPDLIKLNKLTQQFEWSSNFINNKYDIEIVDSEGTVIFQKANHNQAKISIEEISLNTSILNTGKHKIRIKALKPATPSWNLENYIARYPELDSDFAEFEFDIDLEAQVSKPTNLRFSGETNYITSFIWDKPQGSKSFILSLYDSSQNLIHSETLTSGGVYLATPYNNFIRKLKGSGKYTFIVKATATEQNLFVEDKKIVLYKQDSEEQSFEFTYTSGTQLSAPKNIQLSNVYVDHKIQWEECSGAMGYEIKIEDENGNILYSGNEGVNYNGDICYCYTEGFISYLKASGKYKITVIALAIPNIGSSGLSKAQESEPSSFEFYFNSETKEITSI